MDPMDPEEDEPIRWDYPWLNDPEADPRSHAPAPIQEGLKAAKSFRPRRSCPYAAETVEREQWLWGWTLGRRAPMPRRPKRRMPSVKKILEHHGLSPTPACVRCGAAVDVERAHIIDRSDDGLDNCPNIAPLCKWCHLSQPIFHPGEEASALAWFQLPLPDGLAPFVGPIELPPEPHWAIRAALAGNTRALDHNP
jgi:ribosome modulation factor